MDVATGKVGKDVTALVEHFVRKYNTELKCQCPGVSPTALEALYAHDWPGNVRELENTIERALIFAGDRAIEPRDLPLAIGAAGATNAALLAAAILGIARPEVKAALESFRAAQTEKVLARPDPRLPPPAT